MGGRNGKIFNSLNVNFSLSRGEPRDQDPTERSLVHVHSGSLDSISTSVSLATTQTLPTHSSSLDNLHQPRGEGGGRGGGGGGGGVGGGDGGSDLQCNTKKENGKKYMLLETSSVVSGVCADEQRKAMMTQSLPIEVERRITPHSHSHSSHEGKIEIDGFSDNFVGGSAGEEGRLDTSQVKLQLHRDSAASEEATLKGPQQTEVMAESLATVAGAPEIPPGLFEKLSQLSQCELNELVTFVSSTVERSLQSSILEKLALAQRQQKQKQSQHRHHHQQQQQQVSQQQLLQSTEVRGERELLDYERPAVDRSEERGHGRLRRRTRKERPKSLPPPYLKHDCERLEGEVFEGGVPREVGRRRSRSHEDCYHYRCTEPSAEPGCLCKVPTSGCSCSACVKACTCRVHRCHCEHHCRESGHARRKKVGKSKDAPVDISLDDDCPGVPENRVRRKHHHHTICERCLRSLSGEKPRQRLVRPASPDKDKNQDEEEDMTVYRKEKGKGSGSSGEDVDRIGYLTLEELKTAALLLRRSVGHPEDGTSQNLQPLRTKGHGNGRRGEGGASGGRRRHAKTKSKRASDELCNVDTSFLQLQPQMPAQNKSSGLEELVFPVKSRTGRDTPETDMAVINLDMNSPHMLAPIDPENTTDHLYQQAYVVSDSSLNNTRVVGNMNGSTVQHLYFYNHHHHYHHIITHSQP